LRPDWAYLGALIYFLETLPSATRHQAAAVLLYGWRRSESEVVLERP